VTKYLRGGKQVGTSFFMLHRDHLGSIQAVTDSTGAEVRRQKHKPYGDQHTATGSHFESRGWIGEREEETELAYLNARYYDPEIGRFVSPDPLRHRGQGLNRYSYSVNSPVSFSDPSGLTPCVTIFLGANIKLEDTGHEIGFFVICGQEGLEVRDDPPRPGPGQSGVPGSNRIQHPTGGPRPQSPRADRQDRAETGCGLLNKGPCPEVTTSSDDPTDDPTDDDPIPEGSDKPLDDHKEESVTIDEFVDHYDGKTHDEIAFEKGDNSIASAGGPVDEFRYVEDPKNPNQVIDMRHFLVIGFWNSFTHTTIPGDYAEYTQSISGNPSTRGSAYHPQDLLSNQRGAQFFRSSHFNPYMPNMFARQIRHFLRSRP
jgi:RHS repeat-associated protein